MDWLETLRRLAAAHGPSGDEGAVSALLEQLAAPLADDCRRDTLGNLIVHKKGSGPRVMFSAHMDSIGLIATHLDDKGFVRFGKLGGLEAKAIYQAPVAFSNGARGVVAVSEDKEDGEYKLSDLYVDVGASSREEAERLVQVGDTAVFTGSTFQAGNRVISPYLDNRAGCLVLLMALEQVKKPANDLYFVFSVQEEVGVRGAKTAAYGIDPDYGVAVDVTGSDDVPGAVHGCSSRLGAGAAIKVMDSSVICDQALSRRMRELAERRGIPVQDDVLLAGGTDAGAMQLTRSGVITGGISIPCRYVHTPTEMADIGDLKACAGLVAALAESELPVR